MLLQVLPEHEPAHCRLDEDYGLAGRHMVCWFDDVFHWAGEAVDAGVDRKEEVAGQSRDKMIERVSEEVVYGAGQREVEAKEGEERSAQIRPHRSSPLP